MILMRAFCNTCSDLHMEKTATQTDKIKGGPKLLLDNVNKKPALTNPDKLLP